MTNAERFSQIFGLYATEVWAKSEKEFLEWLNADHFRDDTKKIDGDLISRQDAIDVANMTIPDDWLEMLLPKLESLPSVQPGQPTVVQDILQYLDKYLHPIVSPEHWSVYSELYDMVSMLPSAYPEGDTEYEIAMNMAIDALAKQIKKPPGHYEMREMGKIVFPCPECGSDLDGGEDYCKFCGQAIDWSGET